MIESKSRPWLLWRVNGPGDCGRAVAIGRHQTDPGATIEDVAGVHRAFMRKGAFEFGSGDTEFDFSA